jgi:ABC-2 type transport system ATP-binding protein
MSIQVKSIVKTFGSQKALDRVSFEVLPGAITGFLGPNGAGKTTTMRILAGILVPDEGSVEILGKEVRIDDPQQRSQVGYLAENNPLYPQMYVQEYLHFVAKLHGISNISQRVEQMIYETGLNPEAHKKIGQLSKGFRQRVGLAQALIHDPSILILDEPTSGLDPNQLKEIRQLIRSLSHQKTVLLSTHNMQEVEALCQSVIILSEGTIRVHSDLHTLTNTHPDESLTQIFERLTQSQLSE